MQRDAIYCVWCDVRLSTQNLAIDHLLPFSQTHNNNLWNLLPSCKKCSSNTSDSIPTPVTIGRRKERILECWQLEVHYDLVGFEEPIFVAETSLQYLSARCDFLIQERGYNSWNKT